MSGSTGVVDKRQSTTSCVLSMAPSLVSITYLRVGLAIACKLLNTPSAIPMASRVSVKSSKQLFPLLSIWAFIVCDMPLAFSSTAVDLRDFLSRSVVLFTSTPVVVMWLQGCQQLDNWGRILGQRSSSKKWRELWNRINKLTFLYLNEKSLI